MSEWPESYKMLAEAHVSTAALRIAEDQLDKGVQEVTENWGPMIGQYLRAAGISRPAAWCFSGDTEVMTKDGFKRLDSVRSEDVVAQVDPNSRKVTYTHPIAIVEKEHSGTLAKLSSRDFSLLSDAQHQYFGSWGRPDDNYEKRPIVDIGSMLSVPSVYTSTNRNKSWSKREIAIIALFLSDGFEHRGMVETQVSSDAAINEIENWEPPYKYVARKPYGKSQKPLTTYRFDKPDGFDHLFGKYKEPSYEFLRSLDKEQLQHLLSVYRSFDGNTRDESSVRLYTGSEYLRDWLQYAGVLAGYHMSWRNTSGGELTNTSMYEITYSTTKKHRTLRGEQVTFYNGEKKLYCVQVPTGLIIVRDPNTHTTIPVGNCAAFVNWCAEEASGLVDAESPLEEVRQQALVQSYYEWAKADERLVSPPKVGLGDLFLVYFPSRGTYNHMGFVRDPNPNGDYTEFTTVEGNTNDAGGREGYKVASRTRHYRDGVAFIRW